MHQKSWRLNLVFNEAIKEIAGGETMPNFCEGGHNV